MTLTAALAVLGSTASKAAAPDPTAPPQTRITFGPEGPTNLTNPVFAYESDPLGDRFECRLDAVPFAPCGPVEEEAAAPDSGPLAEGPHNFVVRALSPAGIADPTPARAHFIVDAEPPIAEFLAGPFGVTHQRRPKFRIRVSGQQGFWCTIRGAGLKIKARSCDGPRSFRPPRPLADGEYEVAVLAFDRAGNVTRNNGYLTVRGAPRHGEVP